MNPVDKSALVRELQQVVEHDLELMTAAHKEALAGATHAESRAEDPKDMRSTEVSYLARGQAARVAELREAAAALKVFRPRAYAPDAAIGLGAVVELEDDEADTRRVFLAPAGAGVSLSGEILVITPQSPLSRALAGRELDDEVELRVKGTPRSYTVLGVC